MSQVCHILATHHKSRLLLITPFFGYYHHFLAFMLASVDN